MNNFGADNIFSNIPPKVSEHIIITTPPIVHATINLPTTDPLTLRHLAPWVATATLDPIVPARNGQHGRKIHKMVRRRDAEVVEAIVTEDDALQVERG